MSLPWYPWYPGDYMRDTTHLTFVDDAALRRLMDAAFLGTALPDPRNADPAIAAANAEVLLRVCRAFADSERAAVLKMAIEFFDSRDGFLFHHRADEHIAKSRSTSAMRAEAGRRGAAAANAKKSAIAPASAAAIAAANAPASAPAIQNHNQSIKNTCAISQHDDVFDSFAECWKAYPKREGGNSKAAAEKAYRARVKQGVNPADLLAGTERYAAFIRAKGQENTAYVKQASTFFGTGEHWIEPWDVLGNAGASPDHFLGAI
jgi:uncharacterized protein YdaU (DUF1376 family)